MMIEQRRMDRYEVMLPIRINCLKGGDNLLQKTLKTVNICFGGAFLYTEDPLPLKTKVLASVILPFPSELDGHRNSVEVIGTVMRIEDGGMEIVFDKKYKIMPVLDDQLEEI
jgi:hypothetical protein